MMTSPLSSKFSKEPPEGPSDPLSLVTVRSRRGRQIPRWKKYNVSARFGDFAALAYNPRLLLLP